MGPVRPPRAALRSAHDPTRELGGTGEPTATQVHGPTWAGGVTEEMVAVPVADTPVDSPEVADILAGSLVAAATSAVVVAPTVAAVDTAS
jgi:hypothetical protein